MNKIIIVGIILVATVPILIIGIMGLLRERKIQSGWPVIRGTVVEMLDYGKSVRPVVEYQVNGETLRVKNFASSNLYLLPPALKVGQAIDIHCHPYKPEQYRIAGDKAPFLLWGIFSVLGACGVVVSFVVYAVL